MSVESEQDFHIQLHCNNPGQTTISLFLEVQDKYAGQVKDRAILRDEVTFQVNFIYDDINGDYDDVNYK